MNFSEFTQSLQHTLPPEGSIYIKALWYDRKDQWQKAHEMVDHLGDKDACWVHAYLHRKEGDTWNADYWYSRAGRKRPALSLEEEWQQLTNAFLLTS